MAISKNSEVENTAGLSVKLKMLRVQKNMTQKDVATHLGISQQMYSKYETSDVPIESKTLKKLCELYGVSADYLLGIDSSSSVKVKQTAFNASAEDLDALAEMLMSRMGNKKL